MIPRLKPSIGLKELGAAIAFWKGNAAREFEDRFAQHFEQAHGIAFPYGRTGLLFLLEAWSLKNTEVICPAYTCVVVAHAIVLSKNVPVFVDSRPNDLNMDWDLVERAVTERTSCVIATSLFGHPVDLDALDKFRARHPKIKVIQDCAHSFGAEWKGRSVVTAGDAAVFGLNISKIMTSIFGGMVTTNCAETEKSLRSLRKKRLQKSTLAKSISRLTYLAAVTLAFSTPIYGMVRWLERRGFLSKFTKYYDEGKIDMPSDHLVEMTALEARVGLVQLRKLDGFVKQRQRIAARYHASLADQTGPFSCVQPPTGSTFSHFVVRVKDRESIAGKMESLGVHVGRIVDYSIPRMTAYRNYVFHSSGIADNASAEAINLPNFPSLKKSQVEKIEQSFRQSLANLKS